MVSGETEKNVTAESPGELILGVRFIKNFEDSGKNPITKLVRFVSWDGRIFVGFAKIKFHLKRKLQPLIPLELFSGRF